MKPVVVIGAVAAGMSAASHIKRELPEQEVIVFGREKYISYGACGMPYFLGGEIEDVQSLIVLSPETAIDKRHISLKVLHEVTHIDPKTKKVNVKNMSNGETSDQEYEKLVIATGARAVIPNIPGAELKGIFPLKELQDGINLNTFIAHEQPKKSVIIGGGYIGVEIAESFKKRGMEVTLIEAFPRILSIMDHDMSDLVAEEMKRNEVEILTHTKVVGFEGTNRVSKVVLENGKKLDADVVLMSIGVTPNSELAADAGIELGDRKAIRVNQHLKTSDPDIYAAGDCSVVFHRLLKEYVFIPLALGANRQGRLCGENIVAELTGKNLQTFPGIIGTAMTKVFDFEVGKTGIGETEIERYQLKDIGSTMIKTKNIAGYCPKANDIWVKLYFESDTKVIVGGQIVGKGCSILRLDVLVAAISARMTLGELYNLDMGYAPPFSPVWDPLLVAARAAMR